MRAVEKAAFIQSLRIIPQELNAVKDRLSKGGDVPGDAAASLPQALSAIEKLINDKTAMSTLNNAALFAQITPASLVAVANGLVTHRQTVADGINKSIASIVSAYRNSVTPPAGAPPVTGASATASLPKGTTTQVLQSRFVI
jgi:hypothetical protein